jgi:hypothetical protein
MQQQTQRKTFKEKLRPTPAQERALADVVWRCRELYNAALEQRIVAWQRRRISVSRYLQEAELRAIRKHLPVRPTPALQAPRRNRPNCACGGILKVIARGDNCPAGA